MHATPSVIMRVGPGFCFYVGGVAVRTMAAAAAAAAAVAVALHPVETPHYDVFLCIFHDEK